MLIQNLCPSFAYGRGIQEALNQKNQETSFRLQPPLSQEGRKNIQSSLPKAEGEKNIKTSLPHAGEGGIKSLPFPAFKRRTERIRAKLKCPKTFRSPYPFY